MFLFTKKKSLMNWMFVVVLLVLSFKIDEISKNSNLGGTYKRKEFLSTIIITRTLQVYCHICLEYIYTTVQIWLNMWLTIATVPTNVRQDNIIFREQYSMWSSIKYVTLCVGTFKSSPTCRAPLRWYVLPLKLSLFCQICLLQA